MKASQVLMLTVLNLVSAYFAVGNPQTADQDKKQIEVRISPKTKVTRVGEGLELRVEIWNVGSNPLFIEKAIYELCRQSPLSFRLELGPPVKPQPGLGCAADCIYSAKDSFARRLVYQWTTLPQKNFYGTVVALDPDSFPQLNTPGRWRLRGTYQSRGGLSLSPCFDTAPIRDNEEQIKGLPYGAWQGAVETNTVWIEVLPAGSAARVKKST